MHRPAHTAERGFTLIEILVVMIIIAIIMAIAIPTLLTQKTTAKETATRENITQVVHAIESCAANFTSGGYVDDPTVSALNCSDANTLVGFEKSLTNVKIQATPPEASAAGAETTQVQLTPSTQGYIVQRVMADSNVFVYFAQIHTDAGGLHKLCSVNVPLSVDAVAGKPGADSKSCKTGTW